jgi:hypothetical protein
MSFPINDSSEDFISIKNMRSSTRTLTYGTSDLVIKVDNFLSGIQSGTCTTILTYDVNDNLTESNDYYNGILYQTEVFTYGTNGEMISSTVTYS